MEALEFFKARKRMCEATKCASCKLCHMQGGCSIAPENEEIDACEEAIAIVGQWEKEHPTKTRQSEFLKLFPGADVGETDGCLTLDPCNVYKKMRKECEGRKCSECRKAFWLAEVEE